MPSRPLILPLLLALAAGVAVPSVAQLNPVKQGNKGPTIGYDIAFPNAVHHEAEVSATFTMLPAGALHARMARSSTGRYALHEYSKNVYAVRAVDSKGRALRVTRPDAYGWDVLGHDGTVKLSYTVFANRADGTYPGFDLVQAHIQPQGTFLYVRGLEARPIVLVIHKPDSSWTVATQLVGDRHGERFTAPGMQYFFDSPTHLGAIQWREWQEASGGRTQTIRAAVDDPAPASSIDVYADGAKRIVREAAAVFGELPAFDYGSYTFVACYRPSCSGDGMEHRNSTSVTGGNSMGNDGTGPLGTVAHEFFHTWNVKRIRPRTLEPFDYDRANMSDALWIAEGFTQYYGQLLMLRSGFAGATIARIVSGTINAVTNSPGRRLFGPIQMSEQAVFQDAGVSIDQQNTANNFISYYTYGAGIAIALDLSLRTRGKSLDDFMRQMWLRHGKPEIAYTLADARRILGSVAGDTTWANDFWARFVDGHALPDYNALLEPAGLLVRKAEAGAPWIGLNFGGGAGNRAGVRGGGPAGGAAPGYTIATPVLVATPAYVAGLESGDRILTVDGRDVSADSVLTNAIAAHQPGEQIALVIEGRAGRRESRIRVAENPAVQVVTFEEAGRIPSPAQLAFRQAWTSSKVKP